MADGHHASLHEASDGKSVADLTQAARAARHCLTQDRRIRAGARRYAANPKTSQAMFELCQPQTALAESGPCETVGSPRPGAGGVAPWPRLTVGRTRAGAGR